jgi:hypothetical protein
MMESTNQEGRLIRVPLLKRGKEETAIPDRVSQYSNLYIPSFSVNLKKVRI